jgi:ribose transport system permease protein
MSTPVSNSTVSAKPAIARRPSVLQKAATLFATGEAGVVVATLCIFVVFSLVEPAFASGQNLRAILTLISFVGIVAIGQTLLLISGEFDLSVGSVAGFCAVTSGTLMSKVGVPVGAAVACGLLLGAACGTVNGLMVTRLKVPSFIQTLGMLFIGQGLIQAVSKGYPVYPLPVGFEEFGAHEVVIGLKWSLIIFFSVALISEFALRKTVFGRNMYAVGGNSEVAMLVGIDVARYKLCAFALTGLLAALAGILLMADLGSGAPSIGTSWELTVIAGVVVGGVSLFGGRGSVFGGIIGLIFLQLIYSGLVIVGVGANWQQIAVGAIMVVAVAMDVWRRRLMEGHGASS